MCTAIKLENLLGRTLDLEYSYNESVLVVPKNAKYSFKYENECAHKYAIIGVGIVQKGFPLFFDAINEKGIFAAALNFPVNAVYFEKKKSKNNLASFEIIPKLLSQFDTLEKIKEYLKNANITNDAFSKDLPPSPLHWIIADKSDAIAIESTAEGLKIHDNPAGVLTNEPKFDFHISNASRYMKISPMPPKNELCIDVKLLQLSRGYGAIGLPGDCSSESRFIRAIYAKSHIKAEENSQLCVNDFFHVTDFISIPNGIVIAENGLPVKTVYTSCYDTNCLTLYITSYKSRKIRALSLSDFSPDCDRIYTYPHEETDDIFFLNKYHHANP